MVLRQCFRLGDGNIFIAHVFLVFFSADEEKKHVYALEYFVDVWFFSLLRFSASLLCNFCRRLISLRNYLLRLMSAQLMSLTAFKTRDVFAQLLLRLMSAHLMSLTTSTSIDTIARKVQSHSRNVPCARRPSKIVNCASFSLLALVPFNALFQYMVAKAPTVLRKTCSSENGEAKPLWWRRRRRS